MEGRVRRTLRVAVFALSIAVVVALTAGAAATPGPGGWDNVGNGPTPTASAFNGTVSALASGASGVLYAGGPFTDAGGDPGADHLAQWSGGAWKKVGSAPLSGAVMAIAYRSGKVYLGGQFTNAGGNPDADFLAVWDGRPGERSATPPGADRRRRHLPPDHRVDHIRGRDIPERGRHRLGRLSGRVRPGHRGSEVDGRQDGTIGTIYALTADSKGALYAGGRRQDRRCSGRRQCRLLLRRRVACDGHWDRGGRICGRRLRASLTSSGTNV